MHGFLQHAVQTYGRDVSKATFTAPTANVELNVLHCLKFEQGLRPRRGWSGPGAGQEQEKNLAAPWGSGVMAKQHTK